MKQSNHFAPCGNFLKNLHERVSNIIFTLLYHFTYFRTLMRKSYKNWCSMPLKWPLTLTLGMMDTLSWCWGFWDWCVTINIENYRLINQIKLGEVIKLITALSFCYFLIRHIKTIQHSMVSQWFKITCRSIDQNWSLLRHPIRFCYWDFHHELFLKIWILSGLLGYVFSNINHFYQILTTFNKLKIMSEVTHDYWKRLILFAAFINKYLIEEMVWYKDCWVIN